MYPLPSLIPSCANDYAIDIKTDLGPSGLTIEDKGKGKLVNVIAIEKVRADLDALVMPVGKRTTRGPGGSGVHPNKKKEKQVEGDVSKGTKKRRPRQHYNAGDLPLGEGQQNYSLRADLANQKADITFGQLMELCPKLKRQWKHAVNPSKKEPSRGSVRVLSMDDLQDINPVVDAWHKRQNIGEAYIDGGAQVCVITHACVTRLGLDVVNNSGFRIRLANQARVKCLGIIKDMEVEVLNVKTLIDCHVMPAGIGAFPLILGRPWLQATRAIQDWGCGTIPLYSKKGGEKEI